MKQTVDDVTKIVVSTLDIEDCIETPRDHAVVRRDA